MKRINRKRLLARIWWRPKPGVDSSIVALTWSLQIQCLLEISIFRHFRAISQAYYLSKICINIFDHLLSSSHTIFIFGRLFVMISSLALVMIPLAYTSSYQLFLIFGSKTKTLLFFQTETVQFSPISLLLFRLFSAAITNSLRRYAAIASPSSIHPPTKYIFDDSFVF